jgi:hypothetical protein
VDASWVSVAQYSDVKSADFASLQLGAESIPSEVSRVSHSTDLYDLRVPLESADAAKEVLESFARIDEKELTRLALTEPAPDDYVPSSTATTEDPQARRLSVMMPIFSGGLFLVGAGAFAMALATVSRHGPAWMFCSARGCRNFITLAVISGLVTLVGLGAFLGSLGRRNQEK